MTMQDLRQLLEPVIPETYAVSPPQDSPRHIVLNPTTPLIMAADDTTYFSAPRCRADVNWTSPEDAILADAIGVLENNRIPYSLEFDDYDFDDALFGASLTILLLGG